MNYEYGKWYKDEYGKVECIGHKPCEYQGRALFCTDCMGEARFKLPKGESYFSCGKSGGKLQHPCSEPVNDLNQPFPRRA